MREGGAVRRAKLHENTILTMRVVGEDYYDT